MWEHPLPEPAELTIDSGGRNCRRALSGIRRRPARSHLTNDSVRSSEAFATHCLRAADAEIPRQQRCDDVLLERAALRSRRGAGAAAWRRTDVPLVWPSALNWRSWTAESSVACIPRGLASALSGGDSPPPPLYEWHRLRGPQHHGQGCLPRRQQHGEQRDGSAVARCTSSRRLQTMSRVAHVPRYATA
jgi:hypothetical protein